MGSRFVCKSLCQTVNNCTKVAWNCSKYQTIHSLCSKKEPDLDSRFPRVPQYSSDMVKKCWQCNYPFKSELFCQKCKTLQEPPDKLDYFDIMGVKKTFNINNKEIQQKYRQMQSVLHPDKYGNKSKREKEYSEYLSSFLNKAYTTLTNPLNRGLYLLTLNNVSISEGKIDINAELLMEIMEINEAVDEAECDRVKIVTLAKENTQKLDKLTNDVADAFNNGDIKQAQLILLKMKYYSSIDEKLKARKRDLGIVE